MNHNQYNEFIIKIDFEKGSRRPTRVFNAMAEIIDALFEMDKSLAKSFTVNIEPIFILQDIEPGSIKTRLASVLKAVDDDALKELDWKKAVGSFLVKGKHQILKFLEDKKEFTSIKQVNELENKIVQLAEVSDAQIVPFYKKVPTQRLLKNITDIVKATHNLSENDTASLISVEGEVTINRGFYISPETVEELLTKHIISQQSEMILLVKKPDYLGQSMWDVQHNGKIIQAKILDIKWLQKFQNREIDLLPGDSLKALVHFEIRLGDNNVIIGEHYNVLKVIEVLKSTLSEQIIIE